MSNKENPCEGCRSNTFNTPACKKDHRNETCPCVNCMVKMICKESCQEFSLFIPEENLKDWIFNNGV